MRTMTPEERFERIERQLEFLAANQAQNSAQIAENSLQIAKNSMQIEAISKQIEENFKQIAQLADLTLRIGRIVEVQAGHIDALEEKLTQRMEGLAGHMHELAESQRRSDERLDALIRVVERYFSNGHR